MIQKGADRCAGGSTLGSTSTAFAAAASVFGFLLDGKASAAAAACITLSPLVKSSVEFERLTASAGTVGAEEEPAAAEVPVATIRDDQRRLLRSSERPTRCHLVLQVLLRVSLNLSERCWGGG